MDAGGLQTIFADSSQGTFPPLTLWGNLELLINLEYEGKLKRPETKHTQTWREHENCTKKDPEPGIKTEMS